MADTKPPASDPLPGSASTAGPTSSAPKPRNQALRMLGLPALPKKLPSRNWMIFWTLSTTISAAIIYDKREKKRATARWARAVEHLAHEPIADPSAMPRKLTIYLSAPPGDGLRTAQDHFTEYVKPILAKSGLDWEFVQGRRQGDVRAVIAERLRKVRRGWERDLNGAAEAGSDKKEDEVPTADEIIELVRKERGIPPYEGVKGDIVIGRHTWKEYIRGLHEGWLGPLTPPPEHQPIPSPSTETATQSESPSTDDKKAEEGEKKPEDESKPKRPPQPKPYNTVDDYATSSLPLLMPAELAPAAPIREPHILGFLNTPTRMRRFFNRRALADEIGRDVAAVCFNTYREFREGGGSGGEGPEYEQAKELEWEERDWVKSVWKEDKKKKKEGGGEEDEGGEPAPTERIWAEPVVLDSRIAMRMRRYEIQPEDEARARNIVVPEEEIEGFMKGSVRELLRWGAKKWRGEPRMNIPTDDED